MNLPDKNHTLQGGVFGRKDWNLFFRMATRQNGIPRWKDFFRFYRKKNEFKTSQIAGHKKSA